MSFLIVLWVFAMINRQMENNIRIPSARRTAILRKLLLDGAVSVETLAQELGVSVATIRRDLTTLENKGSVRRTHGGATVTAPRRADKAFALREQIDRQGKRMIARTAGHFSSIHTLGAYIFSNPSLTVLLYANPTEQRTLQPTYLF